MSHRSRFVNYALGRLGDTVLWGDLDCSELVARSLKDAGGPDWSETHTAQKLHDEESRELVAGALALPGDLGFYGTPAAEPGKPPHVIHVVIVTAGRKVVSADGATSHINTLEAAKAAGARVRVHETPEYRGDFLCLRRFTKLDELDGVCR